jgi:hypothetical protein
MSRNSKNAQRIVKAREMSASRKNGNGGPAQTTAKHGKKKAWWQTSDRQYRTFAKGKSATPRSESATGDAGFVKRKQPPRAEA